MKAIQVSKDYKIEFELIVEYDLAISLKGGDDYYSGSYEWTPLHLWNSLPNRFGKTMGWEDATIDQLALVLEKIKITYGFFLEQKLWAFGEAYEDLRISVDHLQVMINDDVKNAQS